MPLFYLQDRLNVGGESIEPYTVHGLYQLSKASQAELVERGLVRQIKAPPLSVFDGLVKYDTILEEHGIRDLGDLAGFDPDLTPNELVTFREKALVFLDPGRPATIPPDDCCG